MLTYDDFCEICKKYGLDVEFSRTCCRTVSHGASFVVADYQDEKGVICLRDVDFKNWNFRWWNSWLTEKEAADGAIGNFLKWLKKVEKAEKRNEIETCGEKYEIC